MKVPFVDLRLMHEEVCPEIEAVFKDVFDHSSFVGGSYVDTFEKDFAQYCGVRQAVVCASGTYAVKLALMAAGVRAGDTVIIAQHTYIATTEAITLIGCLIPELYLARHFGLYSKAPMSQAPPWGRRLPS